MFVVVYDDNQVFVAAFKAGKLVRTTDETQMDAVQGALFASAVALSLPSVAVAGGLVPEAGSTTIEGDSDFGTPDAPGA